MKITLQHLLSVTALIKLPASVQLNQSICSQSPMNKQQLAANTKTSKET